MTTRGATAIVYPETDGMPLPDGEYQAPLYVRIVSTLRVHHRDVPGARVNGDTFIYYVEGNPRRSVSPDCYVALGLSQESLESIERNNVYLIWEVGKAPDFVLEIGSRSTASRDLGSKRDRPEIWAASGTCTPSWGWVNTGGTTRQAVTSTANRWWASVWWTASIGGWSCIVRVTAVCGVTARS